ncbi:alginate O-acetyltransferase [Pseudomonas sp. EL_65y_Pfl2_R95]|uniref:alginate O-acetyltransferase n=1 Tax=Pseudomonas sp. EL_65y_Pfl2_R95 TaxID=3088698 RepID=UPI0030D8B0AF
MSKTAQNIYVASFIGVLTLGFISSMSGVLDYKQPNTYSVLDGNLAKSFEDHYDKELPLKDIGTNVWAALDFVLFNEGRLGVKIGADGWLYSDEEFKPDPTGTHNLSDNLNTIEGVRNELAKHNIKLVMAIVPAKARLYPEHIGNNHASPIHADLYQQFHKAMDREGIMAPDLLATLEAAKPRGQLFLRTDTHWTPFGADIAAKRLSAAVTHNFVLPGDPQEYVTSTEKTESYHGDLTRFIPVDPLFKTLMPPPDDLQKRSTVAASQTEGADALFAESNIAVALVGTSYSANPNWNFEGALREHLQRDVGNYAEDGRGPVLPMLGYLQSDDFKNNPPQVVIWEFPERYFPMPNDLSEFDQDWVARLKNQGNEQNLALTGNR